MLANRQLLARVKQSESDWRRAKWTELLQHITS